MTGSPPVASFDSASAMLRALSNALRGRDFARLGQHPLAALPVRASTALPRPLRQSTYAVAGAREGVSAGRLGDVDLDNVAGWVCGHYPARRHPAVFVGSSNGALVHLAAAIGAPWLPQTVLVPVRHRAEDPADASEALDFGARVAGPLLRRNPDVTLHHMHDPNQDALMVRHMAYFRVKRRRLGPAYERWLARSLAPGAPVVLVRDLSRWPTTRVEERHVFQAGAQGGLGPDGYPGPAPDGQSAEAEWGFDDALADDVRRWGRTHGHPVHELTLVGTELLSAPTADLHRAWSRDRGALDRLLVESFVVLDPFHVARTGAVPFWTMFPVEPSARRVSAYLASRPRFGRVDALLFNHGVVSDGLADAATWQYLVAAGGDAPGRLLGVDPERFPVDFAALARYGGALRRLPSARRPAVRRPWREVADALGEADGVTWSRDDGPT
jgi:hypothetical protein